MNGIDRFNQDIQYYSFNRKTRKCWKKAAFHPLYLAKVQAYLVHKMKNLQNHKTQLQFTLDLIEEMTAGAEPPAAFQRRMSDPPRRLKKKHYLTKTGPTSSGKTKWPSRTGGLL